MGWIRFGKSRPVQAPAPFPHPIGKASSSHIEHVERLDIGDEGIRSKAEAKKTEARKAEAKKAEAKKAEAEKNLQRDLEAGRSSCALRASESLPVYSADDIARHDNVIDGFWVVIDDKIYDVTNFIDVHPGGTSFFADFGGRSCTWQFWRFHQAKHLDMWSASLLVGRTDATVPNPFPETPRWIKTS